MSVPLVLSDRLGRVRGARHGFTTRVGGVSVGALAALDLARRPGEDAALAENWARATEAVLGERAPERLALLRQVHGSAVARVTAAGGPLEPVAEADAAVTTEVGLVLAVRVADCVPVLLAAPGGVGVAHAGWRGVAAGVVGEAVRALCQACGARPHEVVAAVGPHIGVDAYEVGEEVVEGIVAAGVPARAFVRRDGPRPHVDLGVAVAVQLAMAGVGAIDRCDPCTSEDRFYSHRLDGPVTGRQAGLIVRTA